MAYCPCDTREEHPASECVAPWQTESEIQHHDMLYLLDALGLGTHARPYSMHSLVHRDILPAIEALQESVRRHRESGEELEAAFDQEQKWRLAAEDAAYQRAAKALRDFADEVDQMGRLTAYAKAEHVVGLPDASLALGAAKASYDLVASKARARADEMVGQE